LTAIRLFAETIERSREDEKTVDQCLDLMREECERLTRRIERLLDWGRMEAGRRLYDLRDQNAPDVIAQAIDAFSPLRTSNVDFASEIDPHLPLLRADRDALVDALVNLLSNAFKYGGTPPVVRLRAYAPATGGVAISVTDNGPGIARPEHRRIFQKFYRIDDRLSREREGSGLGLAIVKHVVRAHRGRIVLESEPGKGSTFTLVLPSPPTPRKRNARAERTEAEASGS
ncbi:MAG TPA: ATP-binding protein, partial [Polyangiaceae bacterium]|nr:ATP-binding protein [Polyangiaceae bacterium]